MNRITIKLEQFILAVVLKSSMVYCERVNLWVCHSFLTTTTVTAQLELFCIRFGINVSTPGFKSLSALHFHFWLVPSWNTMKKANTEIHNTHTHMKKTLKNCEINLSENKTTVIMLNDWLSLKWWQTKKTKTEVEENMSPIENSHWKGYNKQKKPEFTDCWPWRTTQGAKK